jgi:hypothetical protein
VSGVDVAPFGPDDGDQALAVINEAFGFARTREWFDWKHLDGPWGPSRGVLARKDGAVVGVRLLLPWRFLHRGRPVVGLRAVEAATSPRARGEGVFSRLNQALMQSVTGGEKDAFLFSTPNALSREGYRKLGWTWREPAAHVYQPAVLRRSRSAVHGLAAIETYAADDSERLRTDWDKGSLRWRVDPRTGLNYSATAATTSDGTGGAIHRVIRRGGVRILLVVLVWGVQSSVRAALASAARMHRAPAVLATQPPFRGARLKRGSSLTAFWTPQPDSDVGRTLSGTGGWRPTFADLESVL